MAHELTTATKKLFRPFRGQHTNARDAYLHLERHTQVNDEDPDDYLSHVGLLLDAILTTVPVGVRMMGYAASDQTRLYLAARLHPRTQTAPARVISGSVYDFGKGSFWTGGEHGTVNQLAPALTAITTGASALLAVAAYKQNADYKQSNRRVFGWVFEDGVPVPADLASLRRLPWSGPYLEPGGWESIRNDEEDVEAGWAIPVSARKAGRR